MKKIMLIIISLFSFQITHAQSQPQTNKDTSVAYDKSFLEAGEDDEDSEYVSEPEVRIIGDFYKEVKVSNILYCPESVARIAFAQLKTSREELLVKGMLHIIFVSDSKILCLEWVNNKWVEEKIYYTGILNLNRKVRVFGYY